MTHRREWDRVSMPRIKDLMPHEFRRFLELQSAFESASLQLGESGAQRSLLETEFWLPAVARFRHPLSAHWVARRGVYRTPRAVADEHRAVDLCGESIARLFSPGREEDVGDLLGVVAKLLMIDDVRLRPTNISMVTLGSDQGVQFPPFREVPRLLEELFDNYAETDIPPVAAAVGFLVSFLNIHPLIDGNGRCGRAIFSWLNSQSFGTSCPYVPLRKIIELSEGGFEIRVRELELSGNWLPIIDYFISIYHWIEECMKSPAIPACIGKSSLAVGRESILKYEGGALDRVLERCSQLEWGTPFLSSGEAGYALALHQAATSSGCMTLLEKSEITLRSALEKLDGFPLSSSLYSGLTGLGLAICIMDQDGFYQMLSDLDVLLGEGLLSGKNLKFDIINGVSGIVIYANARHSRGGVGRVLAEGLNKAISDILLDETGQYAPKINDLGMAHGLAGLLATAAAAIDAGLLSQELLTPIRLAYNDLWGTVGEYGGTYCAPSKRDSTHPSRVAWCYGSLGTSVSFLEGSSIAPENEARASALIQETLYQLNSGRHAIVDASVCHGWAGCALLLDYISRHQRLASIELRADARAAAEWMLAEIQTLGERNNWTFSFVAGARALERQGLLEGSLGVACAAAAVAERRTPIWASMLGLMSFS